MSDEINLVDVQKSVKPIRNPFGFNFTVKWGKRPITLPGNGQTYQIVGRLRDHIARHLWMKVFYQFHDEKTLALKADGKSDDARKYRVPKQVQDKIWQMITGEPHWYEVLRPETKVQEDDDAQVAADLSALDKELSSLNALGTGGATEVSMVDMVEQELNGQSFATQTTADGLEGGHVTGSMRTATEVVPPAGNTTPTTVAELSQDASVQPDKQPESSGPEFADLPKDDEK